MPTEPITIPKSKIKNNKKQQTKHWSCEKHPGCMWSCPCDCNNCLEYNRVNKISKTNNINYK